MKKIMFNDRSGLTAAVLEGQKTMTRRFINLCEKDLHFMKISDQGEYLFCSKTALDGAFPKYKVGEVIAIAQRYCDVLHYANVPKGDEKGWNNKMFVKADLMPHHIKITNIKVERLQDISDEDCLREGIDRCEACYEAILLNRGAVKYLSGDCSHCYKTPREAFASLIDKVSGKGTWSSNPYCFCYTFKLIK